MESATASSSHDISVIDTIDVSSTITTSKGNGFSAPWVCSARPGTTPMIRCSVPAVRATRSGYRNLPRTAVSKRVAAFPVGAVRATVTGPRGASASMIRETTVVLPDPGPPVMTQVRALVAARTAASWVGSGTMPGPGAGGSGEGRSGSALRCLRRAASSCSSVKNRSRYSRPSARRNGRGPVPGPATADEAATAAAHACGSGQGSSTGSTTDPSSASPGTINSGAQARSRHTEPRRSSRTVRARASSTRSSLSPQYAAIRRARWKSAT